MTKPFKVGERVRIYGRTMRGNDSHKLTGFIEEICEDGFVYVKTDDIPNTPSRCFVHFKQCRRLRKKKRRRVFVQAAFLKEHPNLTPLLNWCVDSPIVTTSSHGSLKPPGDWVEFIETKEKT